MGINGIYFMDITSVVERASSEELREIRGGCAAANDGSPVF